MHVTTENNLNDSINQKIREPYGRDVQRSQADVEKFEVVDVIPRLNANTKCD